VNTRISCTSPDAGNERQGQSTLESSPIEGRSLRTTEVVYAVFALAVGILLFATAV